MAPILGLLYVALPVLCALLSQLHTIEVCAFLRSLHALANHHSAALITQRSLSLPGLKQYLRRPVFYGLKSINLSSDNE